MPSLVSFSLSIACGVLSVSLGLYVGRRKFYRRNPQGIETFPNYRSAVVATLWEKLLQVVTLLGLAGSIGLFFMSLIMRCGGADEPVQYKTPRSAKHVTRDDASKQQQKPVRQ